ncbi:uncharacterized protein LOC131883244 isoform X3 [Tigriopus californicus]|uniref:uncharacterized protein LOC131883244 isoform X3 n=1 Tax=Tigriopus californicus TaxID=6832 RepID=UPI0027DAA10B|nr:uncharacterized protein LOC131883244 isoform X3 [Tigriopus californicus]
MHKMWSFSTLQRPTHEEKERKRRFREEQKRQAQSKPGFPVSATLNPAKGKVGRAKTFRQETSRTNDHIIEALRFRAKSATRAQPDHFHPQPDLNDNYYGAKHHPSPQRSPFTSSATLPNARLRFLERNAYLSNEELVASSLPNHHQYRSSNHGLLPSLPPSFDPSRASKWEIEPGHVTSNTSGYSSGGGPNEPGSALTMANANLNPSPKLSHHSHQIPLRHPRNHGGGIVGRGDDLFDLYAQPMKNNSSTQSASGIMKNPSCGPTTNGEMVSRRKILSRSRDDLNLDVPAEHPEEEDVWYQKEKLFKDHIQEVLNKWESIDDEIWAKIIVLERNRRVAKAYARAPVLTVNGSDDGFDGFRIGLSGFENPMRDPKTDEVKRHIGQGCKIKMDDSGNILIKRIAKSNVYIKSTLNTPEDTAIANDILKLPNGGLEAEKPVKLFDMKKFQQNVSRELKRGYPDRRKLECQCISAVAFVKNEADILEAPCWIMLINVVAMDMLKSKMPPDIRNRPRIPIPDEDPYSIAGSGSSGSSGNGNRERSRDKPPKLPPRDNNAIYGTTGMPRPDYEHMVDEHRFRQQLEARNKAPKKGEKRSDDPYYCGLRARIPNFAKTKAQRDKEAANSIYARLPTHAQPQAHPGYGHIGMYGPARGFLDNVPPTSNNMNNGYSFRNRPFERNPTTWVPKAPMRNDYESDYSHIYGRLPLPTRFRHAHGPPGRQMYVSEWE